MKTEYFVQIYSTKNIQKLDFPKIYTLMVISAIIFGIVLLLLILWKKTDFSLLNFINVRSKTRRQVINKLYTINHDKQINNFETLNHLFKTGQRFKQINKKFVSLNIIEVIKLPEWMDISAAENEIQRKEYFERQINTYYNFIACCNEGMVPVYQGLFYDEGKLRIYYWTTAETIDRQLKQLEKINQFLQISFKGIVTKIVSKDINPILELTNNHNQSFTTIRGAYITGPFVKELEITQPFIDQLNSLFRLKEKSGFVIFSDIPQTQKGFFHWLGINHENRKFSNLSMQVESNISSGDSKKSSSSKKINWKKQLDLKKSEILLKRLKAKKVSNLSLIFNVIGHGKTQKSASIEAENTFSIVRASLFPFLQSNSQFPMELYDLSSKEIEDTHQKIFTTHNFFPSDFLTLLPDEVAMLCRLPSTDTLPIAREQKTFSQVKLPESNPRGILLGKIIGSDGKQQNEYLQHPNDFVYQTLITGTTGSGKTCTICSQAIALEKLGIKSLIIDPKGTIFPILQKFIPDIQIFNFGKETVAPGRCNILECPNWMNVQTHLNLVENILLSVWQIFPPMNMILHRALSRLYNTDGWSVRHNKHGENRTLVDLQKEIRNITRKMGYSQETHTDITSAMEMRLDYFMQGQIGTQINCLRSIPIEDLLEKTTIISLEHANNYAEKVVVLTFLGRIF